MAMEQRARTWIGNDLDFLWLPIINVNKVLESHYNKKGLLLCSVLFAKRGFVWSTNRDLELPTEWPVSPANNKTQQPPINPKSTIVSQSARNQNPARLELHTQSIMHYALLRL